MRRRLVDATGKRGFIIYMQTKEPRLQDRIAVVTGAANGIGRAIAREFFGHGAQVVLADAAESGACEAAQELDASSRRAFGVKCDITSLADTQALARAAMEQFGRIDILVNNAAIALPGHVAEMSEADWQRVIDTNLTGAFRCIQAVLPAMLEQEGGCVINIASTQAHRSWKNWTAYAAAKGGLLAMTTQLAGQFAARKIRFNSISPGTINTPMNEQRIKNEGEAMQRKWSHMHAMERIGEPEEVSRVALFLAGDDASFVTGQDIIVDGGLCCLPRIDED